MRRRGETERQYMDRLRAVRGLPPMESDPGKLRDQLMGEVAAARCYLDRAMSTSNPGQQRRAELAAFMSIFHPEVPQDRVTRMLIEVAR